MLLVACAEGPTTPPDDPDSNSEALNGRHSHAGSGNSCTPRDTADTTCDRIDDDCDGRKDEDCDFGPSDCPHGYRVITGTFNDDTLTGTSQRDCILGYGGDDTIEGLGNDDLLVGGPGDDAIEGGPGDDDLFGNEGADDLSGGLGKDKIEGGDGNDVIDSGAGNDDVNGGLCHDLIRGGLGQDELNGDKGSDRIISLSILNDVDGGNGIDACSGSNCEVSLLAAVCTSDAQCSGGKRCVVATGICVSPSIVPFTDTTCDGKDDDCDGHNDENFAGGSTTCGVGACQRTGGAQCVNGDVVGSTCMPGTPAPNDNTCNNVDDDCDGRTDEGFVGGPVTCGVGACARTGTMTCVAGQVQNTCTPGTPAANDATCNGVDDDCDSDTDEDYQAQATGCGIGVCARSGMTSCSGGMVMDSCMPGAPAANDASCNGMDDDCSGQNDEDFVSMATTCGMGACTGNGMTSCVAGSVHDSCTPGSSAGSDATCDGVDDDCSGQADEDYVPHGTLCGVGECERTGVTSCSGGSEHNSCTPGAPAPSDPTCDGADDDCDATSDEDYASAPTQCGVGACASTGATSCVGGQVEDNCTPGQPAANDASCDGSDDDCDATNDEDFPSEGTVCGVGACQSTGSTSCVMGQVQNSCTPDQPAANDATCNGIDDDCDATSDEDFAPTCQGSDSITCVGGQQHLEHCNDGDACNGVETCTPGSCVDGTPVETDDGDLCTTDACDPQTGSVTNTPVPEGTSCSDGEVCNGEELCLLSGGSCANVPSGAVSWWRAEGTPNDFIGGNHAVLTGNATYTAAGHTGQAFTFDGSNEAADLSAHAAGINLAGQATIEGWIRFLGTDVCKTVLVLTQDGTHAGLLQVGGNCTTVLTNELITYTYINGPLESTVGFTTTTRSLLIDANWHHLAVTFDGTATRMYLDGVSQPVSVGSGAAHGLWGNFPAPVTAAIGGRNLPPNFSNVLNGQIDELTLYNRPLSGSEVATIFLAGTTGKCTTAPVMTCVEGEDELPGEPCGVDGMCDGAGMCVP